MCNILIIMHILILCIVYLCRPILCILRSSLWLLYSNKRMCYLGHLSQLRDACDLCDVKVTRHLANISRFVLFLSLEWHPLQDAAEANVLLAPFQPPLARGLAKTFNCLILAAC